MSKPFRILSIDGGGIRGILPGQLLVELEKKLQILSNNQQARIADYFDMIAGTSTGGILTCLYLYPDENDPKRPFFTAEEAVNLYIENGGGIFNETSIAAAMKYQFTPAVMNNGPVQVWVSIKFKFRLINVNSKYKSICYSLQK